MRASSSAADGGRALTALTPSGSKIRSPQTRTRSARRASYADCDSLLGMTSISPMTTPALFDTGMKPRWPLTA